MHTGQMKTSWLKKTVLFLVSQSVTLFGSTLVQMAIVWYVTKELSSGAWVAALTVCAYLPQFLISFMGGVMADRYSRKKLIIGADTVIAAATLMLMLAMPYIKERPYLLGAILTVSVIRSLGAGIQMPAVNAAIVQLVPSKQLMRFNGINATIQAVVQFAAPAAAGAVLTFSTLRSTLAIDLASAAVGIGVLSFVHIGKINKQTEKTSSVADMKLGVKYAFSDKMLGKLLIIYGLFIFLSVPAGFLAQLFVSREYNATYFYMSAVELVGFAGMTIGGIVMGTWGGFKKRTTTLTLGLFAFGLLAVGMGLSRNFLLYLAFMLLYGVALTMVQTATTTLIQEYSEEAMQGRVFGLLSSMYSGFLPIGMAVFGPLADIVEMRWVMAGSGVALIVISLLAFADKKFVNSENK